VAGDITVGDGNSLKPKIVSQGFPQTYIEYDPNDITIAAGTITMENLTVFHDGIKLPIAVPTTDYTCDNDDFTVVGNPGSGARITVTLPTLSGSAPGRLFVIKNNLTSATDTVDINNSLSVRQMRLTDGQGCWLQDSGSAWIVLGLTTGY
jgi:hypothetical protein